MTMPNTCLGCGIEIPADKKYCPLCEQKLTEGKLAPVETAASPEAQAKYLRGFSWGAATTGIVYLIAMRISLVRSIIWILVILAGSFTFGISELAAFLWLGFAGRKLAWQAGDQSDFNKFMQTQNGWDRYGKILLVVDIVLIAVIIYIGLSFIGPNLPTLNDLNELKSEIQ